MNYKLLGRILGKIMILEGILMLAPFAVSIIYKEGLLNNFAFAIPIFLLVLLGSLLQIPKPKKASLYQKEGFALTALVWIIMTLFGAVPFVINGDITNYIDACFEIMSGFTTTGSSIITDITLISHSSLFWRSFSHWIGGMGILVFVLIFIPESDDGSSMHLLRAESPGPQVGKIVSKMKVTSRILYLIYLGMTVLQVIILMCGPLIDYAQTDAAIGIDYRGDKLFHALLTAFGSAGTGGFGCIPNSLEYFTPFAQYVVSIFLILFGCNFALYYLILIGKAKHFFRSEELRIYLLIIISSVSIVFMSLVTRLEALGYSVEEGFRHSLLQVTSLMTTAGFTSTDYNLWPNLAVTTLVVVMIFGSMAGSTAGGVKISRLVIAVKGTYVNIRKLINPRYVPKTKFEGKSLEEKTTNDVFAFFTLYFLILMSTTLLLSIDPINGEIIKVTSDIGGAYEVKHGFFSNFSASLACLSNVGPAFEAVGPYCSFAGYNWFSTLILTLTMLLGRLEILPVLILFTPRTWKRT